MRLFSTDEIEANRATRCIGRHRQSQINAPDTGAQMLQRCLHAHHCNINTAFLAILSEKQLPPIVMARRYSAVQLSCENRSAML
jgi:hypothetical protein